jgi:sRNA-binding carbon storage regulator CsrA
MFKTVPTCNRKRVLSSRHNSEDPNKFNSKESKNMRKFKFRRLIAATLSVVMILAMISIIPVSANDSSNISFYSQSAQLIAENWSDDYFGSIVMKINESMIIIDGEEKEIGFDDTNPLIVDNNIMLPVETILNEIGVETLWDECSQTMIIENDGDVIELLIDSDIIVINNEPVHVDTAPIVIEETIMLSICVLADNLGLEAEWDSSTGEITLTRDFQTKRIIVKTNSNVSFCNLGAETMVSGRDGIHVLQFSSINDAKEAHNVLNGMNGVVYIEPDIYIPFINAISTAVETVADTVHKSWGVEKIGADKYAAYLVKTNKATPVTVAVLDTGVDPNHPFLNGRVRNDGINTIDGGTNTSDIDGHGTHVAGTIIDCTPNLNNITILPVKVLNDFGSGTWLSVGNGISFAADKSVQVINMSLGGWRGGSCWYVDDMVQYAINKNSTVVVAAGNDAWDVASFCPAHIENVITVAAVDSNYKPAWFSNFGGAVDVAAPGVNVNSSIPGNKFASYSGTSMAAPHVAAIAAMFILNDSSLTPSTVQNLVKQYYDVPAGWQSIYGVGIINIAKALDVDIPDGSDDPDEPEEPCGPDVPEELDEIDEPDTPDVPSMPTGIVLTLNNTSATANVDAGVDGRVPVTVTAPSANSVTVTLNAPGGTSNANDPALYNSEGTRIAYQNNGWGFTHTLTISAGQSWSGFVGTGGDIARTYNLTSFWSSQNTLTLNPTSVTVDDSNLTRTITAGGTATGEITFNRGTLPTEVQLSASDNTITATGSRPAAGQAAITGTYIVTVNRDGRSTQLSVNVNLTPQVSGITLTQSNSSATANVGTGINGRVPITVTAPSNNSVTITLNAPSGSTNANDPALYNSAGTRIAYQNDGLWGFKHTIALNAGQSWSGFVGTGGDVARTFSVTSSGWIPPVTLILNPSSTTVDDNNLTHTITATGTATGTITFNRGTLPSAVQLSVSGNTITATGSRPAAGQAAITGTHTVIISRGGVSTHISVSVNLTPPVSGITLTQNSASATANVGTGVNNRVPITVTAPSTNSVTVTLNAPGGTSNANDPALYNSAGARIAYQNNGWGFSHTLTISAGQSWSGFVGTGGDVARSFSVTSSGWVPPATLTLNPTSITVDDNNFTRTITIGGTAEGSFTVDRGTLPLAVQLSVSGHTITATGSRPAAGQAAITGTHIVTVNRAGISAQLSVNVNLTPQVSGIILTQNNTSATANVGTGVSGRVPITVTAPSTNSVTVTLSAPGGTSDANDPALYNSAGARIAYQNNGWGFSHTLTINAGQSWSGFIGTGGNVSRTYTVTSSGWNTAPTGIVLTQSSTSATATVGSGINNRVPVTVTAPSNNSVKVTLNAPGGTSDANDPALYNSAGARIAYQNNGWGFTHTITLNAGQSWSGFVGTGGNVARQYTLTSAFTN